MKVERLGFNGKRIVITGGAGFVGSHLADALVAAGCRVTVLDNLSTGFRENVPAQATLVEGDVRDRDLVTRLINENDACFHLAAIASVQQCNENPVESHAVNLESFVGLLDSVAKRPGGVIPVVYASSAAVYGDVEQNANENLPLNPISLYGKDKAGCEIVARAAGETNNVPTFGLRPFNIYGTRQHATSPYSGVITVFANRLKRGEGITIYGNGNQTRDFISVHDVVRFFIAGLNKASSAAPFCNAATGKETSVLDLAHKIAHVIDVTPNITFAPARAGDIYRSVADTAHATSLLGYTAQTDIDEGLQFIS